MPINAFPPMDVVQQQRLGYTTANAVTAARVFVLFLRVSFSSSAPDIYNHRKYNFSFSKTFLAVRLLILRGAPATTASPPATTIARAHTPILPGFSGALRQTFILCAST